MRSIKEIAEMTMRQIGYSQDKRNRFLDAYSSEFDKIWHLSQLEVLNKMEAMFEEFEKSESKDAK